MDKNIAINIIDALERLKEYCEMYREKRIDKSFVSLSKTASLKEVLGTYTKAELDEIRKNLNLSGVSSLKKADLIIVLEDNIKRMLPSILEKLTDKEYKLVNKMIKNDGMLKYDNNYLEVMLYLRKYGIISNATEGNKKRFLIIPQDIFEDIAALVNRIDIISKIKLNDKINKLAKGLLFYYGVLDNLKMVETIESYLTEPVSSLELLNILLENSKKEYGLVLSSSYWCHDFIHNYNEVIREQKLRGSLAFYKPTTAQLMAAAEDNYREWNEFDKKFYMYLINNFDIPKAEAEDFIDKIKIDLNNGISFSDTMKDISECFQLENLEQAQIMCSLLQDLYNNSRQWALKGHSPKEISTSEQKHLTPLPKAPSKANVTKTGRNDACPCGSGKKYKNCCLGLN